MRPIRMSKAPHQCDSRLHVHCVISVRAVEPWPEPVGHARQGESPVAVLNVSTGLPQQFHCEPRKRSNS
jgi:hypothetical protein